MQLNENQEKDVLNVLRENKVVPYHPQISGQVEVSNWEIKMILQKMVNQTTKIGLLNKGIDFSFPPLKLPNKRREEYSKNIHFIPFPPLLPNRA